MKNYQYRVYGLNLCSEIELPELVPVQTDNYDVTISFGKVPEHLPEVKGSGVLYEARFNDFLFKFDGIGRYRVQNGNQITIQPEKNAHPEEIRLFLLGSNLGALLHQRGILAIHGSAVVFGNKTTILSGNSGVGKSSLAAGLLELGYSVLADDISVIGQHKKEYYMVEKGIPHLKLWKDVLAHLNQPRDLEKIRPQLEKYRKPIPFKSEETSILTNLVVLSSTNNSDYKCSEIIGGDKFLNLRSSTYRLQFIDKLQQTKSHFQNLSKLVNSLKMYHVQRPHSPLEVREFAKFVSSIISNE